MTTIPTEEEIVARAIAEADGFTGFSWPDGHFGSIAKAAISALDQYRAKNAGEVEGLLRARRGWTGMIQPEGKLSDAELLTQAANLISSMRSVIEEKDRALRPFVDYLNAIDPQDFASDESEIGIEIIGPFRRAIKFRDLRLTRSTISDGVK